MNNEHATNLVLEPEFYECETIRPYKALCAAVMLNAMQDLAMAWHNDIPCTDDEEWLYSNAHEPYSFVWCCEVLGMKPEKERKKFEKNWRMVLTEYFNRSRGAKNGAKLRQAMQVAG